MKIRSVVIDTNVILSGLKSKNGFSYKLIKLLADDVFHINISVPLVLEYEAVLIKYQNLTGLASSDIKDFIDYICRIGKKTKIYYLWRPILKDPYNDHVLEVAVASESTHLITFNSKDFEPAGKFGIKVVSPKEFYMTEVEL